MFRVFRRRIERLKTAQTARTSFLLFDAVLHQRTEVWVLHGGCYSFLVVDLFVNFGEREKEKHFGMLLHAWLYGYIYIYIYIYTLYIIRNSVFPSSHDD